MCRSEPQMADRVTRTTASRGSSIVGSGTSSTRISCLPYHRFAFMSFRLSFAQRSRNGQRNRDCMRDIYDRAYSCALTFKYHALSAIIVVSLQRQEDMQDICPVAFRAYAALSAPLLAAEEALDIRDRLVHRPVDLALVVLELHVDANVHGRAAVRPRNLDASLVAAPPPGAPLDAPLGRIRVETGIPFLMASLDLGRHVETVPLLGSCSAHGGNVFGQIARVGQKAKGVLGRRGHRRGALVIGHGSSPPAVA